jgi:hypothetical protein
MVMPSSVNGGKWVSGDTIGVGAANLKTVLDIPFNTYTPSIGTDTVAGELVIDSNGCVLYVVNAANNAYGIAINQSLRTTDSPTFVALNLSGTLLDIATGDIGFGIQTTGNNRAIGNFTRNQTAGSYNIIWNYGLQYASDKSFYIETSADLKLLKLETTGKLTVVGDVVIDNGGTPFTLTSAHLQNLGSGDSPTFVGLTISGNTLFMLGTTNILYSSGNGICAIGSNVKYSNGWIAEGTQASLLRIGYDTPLIVYWNNGLTNGNGYTPLQIMSLDSSGNLSVVGTVNGCSLASSHFQNLGIIDSPTFSSLVMTGNSFCANAFYFSNNSITSGVAQLGYPSAGVFGIANATVAWQFQFNLSNGNLVIGGKLTQSGCLPENTSLKDVLAYIKKVQPLKRRETQTEVDALERIVLNQQKQIEGLLKRLGND